jgi:hypothetical protein
MRGHPGIQRIDQFIGLSVGERNQVDDLDGPTIEQPVSGVAGESGRPGAVAAVGWPRGIGTRVQESRA